MKITLIQIVKRFKNRLLIIDLPAAGKTGALHVWQKHCITESRTNPISILNYFLFLYMDN